MRVKPQDGPVSDPSRYAIYFVPRADSPLYTFGSAVLGYDCYTGADLDDPRTVGLPDDGAALTAEPRRYGFHATLKAPFHLAPGANEAALLRAFKSFAEAPRSTPMIQPVVRLLGPFVAIVPHYANAALDQLAADCVIAFDHFRAPPSPSERARRLQAPLSARHKENIERWGYPYVFDDFRFHMTLTGALPEPRREAMRQLLDGLFTRANTGPVIALDCVTLVRQADLRARFRVLHQLDLAPAKPSARAQQAASHS